MSITTTWAATAPALHPALCRADPPAWRSAGLARDELVRRAHGLQRGGAGLSGVINMAQYSGWGHMGFHWITPFHNIAGMLTESASARLATPLFIHPDQLRGGTRAGCRVRGADRRCRPLAGRLVAPARHRRAAEDVGLGDCSISRRATARPCCGTYLKASRQTERGAAGPAKAYVIRAAQHDPLTAK
jgi:hypothetical protein